MKPFSTWLLAAVCFTLLLGAMAWTTRSLVRMEDTQNRMAQKASEQEMTRLALWRMESIASSLVITESARPPEHYRTLSAPSNLFSYSSNTAVRAGEFVSCSPIVTEPPPRVVLHFEMDQSGTVRSPQAPSGWEREVSLGNGWVVQPRLNEIQQKLAKLQALLQEKTSKDQAQLSRDLVELPVSFTDNRSLVWRWNYDAAPANSGEEESADKHISAVTVPAAATNGVQEGQAPSQVLNNPQQAANRKPEEFAAQQSDLNTKEANTRAAITRSQVIQSRTYADFSKEKALSKNFEPSPPKPSAKAASKSGRDLLPSPANAAASNNAPVPAIPPVPQDTARPADSSVIQQQSVSIVSDFRALWLGEALLITRRVSDGTREWIQGAWIDWLKVKEELWAAVRADFPNGEILSFSGTLPAGAHLLASLPVRLLPGRVDFTTPPFWTPLKASLSIAWVCVFIGVAAVALMLRGMMALSERRASFVSSVTHELRTPLATFKLYSEMLADGMVREEAKRQQYLETLTTEADRLGHLVENVLAYSRIERGKGPVTLSSTTADDLVRRIEPRLNQRAMMGGMDFSITLSPECAATALRTDGSAVEQILFNLVDNACKYGHRDGGPRVIELHVGRDRRCLHFAVRDHGPGIDPKEKKALFLPFHKSAREAAHSAPGVGLGLALCRRLAAEVNGRLTVDTSWRKGASFVLSLPVRL